MLSFIQYIYIIIIGILYGGVSGSIGTSGSSIIVPGLLITGIASDYKTAAGTTLLTILAPVTLGSAYVYWKAGYVQVTTAIILMIAAAVAATFASSYVVKHVSDKTLLLIYAIYLLLISTYFFYKYAYE